METYDQNILAASAFAYEPDDGPLSAKQVDALRKDVQAHYPRGALLSKQTLFDDIERTPHRIISLILALHPRTTEGPKA